MDDQRLSKQHNLTLTEFDAARLEKFCERYDVTKSAALRHALLEELATDELYNGLYDGIDYPADYPRH